MEGNFQVSHAPCAPDRMSSLWTTRYLAQRAFSADILHRFGQFKRAEKLKGMKLLN